MAEQNLQENFLAINKFGMAGLNTLDDPKFIQDNELADARNIVFDSGHIAPRAGFTEFITRPAGETEAGLQIMEARTSDGVDFMLPVYGNHFYLFDKRNTQLIRLNFAFVPTEKTIKYGFKSWNDGFGDDSLYFGNGKDNSGRWNMSLDYADGAHSAGASTLTLEDGSRFPLGGGILIIKTASVTFEEQYTSRTGNVFTLTGTLANDVADGDAVTQNVQDLGAGVPKGKIFEAHQRRMFIANNFGGESIINYSKINDPEDFGGSGISAGGLEEIADGEGQLTGMFSFGEYLLLTKFNTLHKFSFTFNDALNTKLVIINPIVSGQSVGPISPEVIIKALNVLYYTTETEGIFALAPISTGADTSIDFKVISDKINNLVTDEVDFGKAASRYFDQKLFWAVAEAEGSENSLVLMYDLLFKSWSILSNWTVKDFVVHEGDLYFMSNSDHNINKAFQDFLDGEVEFETFATSKRYTFGDESLPKSMDKVFVEGFIDTATELFIDVLFNEAGTLGQQTYKITGSDPQVIQFVPESLGTFALGTVPLGGVTAVDLINIGVFRVYLDISNVFGWYNLQLKFRTTSPGARFNITTIGFNPFRAPSYPPELVVGPTS